MFNGRVIWWWSSPMDGPVLGNFPFRGVKLRKDGTILSLFLCPFSFWYFISLPAVSKFLLRSSTVQMILHYSRGSSGDRLSGADVTRSINSSSVGKYNWFAHQTSDYCRNNSRDERDWLPNHMQIPTHTPETGREKTGGAGTFDCGCRGIGECKSISCPQSWPCFAWDTEIDTTRTPEMRRWNGDIFARQTSCNRCPLSLSSGRVNWTQL